RLGRAESAHESSRAEFRRAGRVGPRAGRASWGDGGHDHDRGAELRCGFDRLKQAAEPVATTLRAVEDSANAARENLANILAMSGAMKETSAAVQSDSASAER